MTNREFIRTFTALSVLASMGYFKLAVVWAVRLRYHDRGKDAV